MRHLVHAAAVAVAAAAAVLAVQRADAGGIPAIGSIVEGREANTNKEVLVIVGSNLSTVSQFNFADSSGTLVGVLTMRLKTKNLLVFGLPEGVAAGTYTVRLFYGKGASRQIQFDVVISNLQVPPGTVTGASLDSLLRVDLDDASTVGGRDPSYLLDAAHLTGTIDNARFSAYGDLVSEVRIGTVAGTLAAGDHAHDGRYVLRGGDTLTNASFTIGSTGATAVAGTTGAAAAAGLSGTNTAAGGVGVLGAASATTGATAGVRGTAASAGGSGVQGDNSAATGVAAGVTGNSASATGAGVAGNATNAGGSAAGIGVDGTSASGFGVGVRGTSASGTGTGVYGQNTASSGSGFGVWGAASSAGGIGVFAQSQGVALQADGQTLGAQVTSQGANALLVQGAGSNLAVFQVLASGNATSKARIDNNGKGYFNGGTATSGADFAESVETARPAKEYEPGDVIVIDTTGTRRFALSSSPNSKLVAGVYATKPGVLARPGDVAGDGSWAETEVPMAIVGIVPCKVCDENGPVETGDLLVTSSTPGRAMKAPANPAAGTVVGKALGNLAGRTGKIEVLLIGR